MNYRFYILGCMACGLLLIACGDSSTQSAPIVAETSSQEKPVEQNTEEGLVEEIQKEITWPYERDSSWANLSAESIGISFEIPSVFVESEKYVENENAYGELRSAQYIYSDSVANTKILLQFYFGENGNYIYENSSSKLADEDIPQTDIVEIEIDGCEAVRKTMIITNNGKGRELGMELRRELLLIRPNGRDGSFRMTYSSDAITDAGREEIDEIINSIRID